MWAKFKIGATIPTVQYGNIMPEIEVEAESLEQAQAIALPEIEKLWARYAEEGKALRTSGQRVKAFVGEEIDYDDLTHTYSWEGEVYLSASQYAKTFETPFDKDGISAKMATKYKVKAEDILAMWKLKSETSKGFGTAIHAAIELYERFRDVSETMERLTHLHDHPVLKEAVSGFYELQGDGPAKVEVVVVDHFAKRAGRIDRLWITGSKSCRIQDIKTNADITKSLDVYWKQLEFYQEIMENHGWTVSGLDIFHWNGKWTKYNKETE